MAIIGHNIMSVSANRSPTITAASIDINSSPKIVKVKEKEIDVVNISKKVAVLGIEFEFVTDYKPNVGEIKMSGEVVYTGADNKKVMKEWEKSKKLPQDVDIEVKNFLLRKCLLIGTSISQEMQLPPPIVIPFITPDLKGKKEKELGYIG